ncbi:MAG: acyl-CoA mutase large subunit family protein [Bacteroidetes bacterium]|nr:acyl-CoA mutase large subunit family protein [Bacteroidota bacterium]
MENQVKLTKEFKLKGDFTPPSFDEWKDKVIADLKGASYAKKLITNTYEGISLQPIYTRADIENLPLVDGKPGFTEYVRGTKASGYLGNGWEVCQEIPYSDADEFNSALISDINRGQNSINVILDSATQLLIDADYAEMSKVGDKGLSISGLSSFSRAFDNVDIEKYPLHIQTGFVALPMLMILSAYVNKTGKQLNNIKGSVEADPIGYIATEGKLPLNFNSILDKMKIAIEWTHKYAPGIRTIGISGLPYNNGGASAVQELAFVMSTAVEYINSLLDKGVNVNDIANNMRFTFAIGPNYFMEIAKLRAARVIWSNILDSYGADTESKKIVIHGRTSKFNQTMYDPNVNMLRTTTEAFSAIVGGIDSLHTNTYDESYSVPGEFSRRIARNTQIILKEEAHLNNVIDPAGGSYYVEWLTNEIANNVWQQFKLIEEKGGMLSALKTGYIQDEINKIADVKTMDIRKRKNVLVGTNSYANTKENKPDFKLPDYKNLFTKRAEFLQKFRVSGNSDKHAAILDKLNSMVDLNTLEIIDIGTEAVLAGATLGEISHFARINTEEAESVKPLNIYRAAEVFEKIRNSLFDIEEKNGSKPKVFLATMGSLKQFKVRADFSRSFFELAGFDIIYPNGFSTTEAAVDSAIESRADAVIICSTDDEYPEIVPELTKGVKDRNGNTNVILAGFPKEQIEAYKQSGVDDFIYLGCDAYGILSNLINKILNK